MHKLAKVKKYNYVAVVFDKVKDLVYKIIGFLNPLSEVSNQLTSLSDVTTKASVATHNYTGVQGEEPLKQGQHQQQR